MDKNWIKLKSVLFLGSSICSNNWNPVESLKENFEPDSLSISSTDGSPILSEYLTDLSNNGSNLAHSFEKCAPKKLTVIAKHRRLGEESLSRLKEDVRKYALDHTFKETAKKFGIHHSTVSGWVKARERLTTYNGFMKSKLSKTGCPILWSHRYQIIFKG